jgi:hypothetical protein
VRSGQTSLLEIAALGLGGAVLGALGTVIVSRLIPESKPGDGYSARWISGEGIERRIDFGEDEKAALQKAIDMASTFPGVEVIEIRQGRVRAIQRAGTPLQEVAA